MGDNNWIERVLLGVIWVVLMWVILNKFVQGRAGRQTNTHYLVLVCVDVGIKKMIMFASEVFV